MKNSLFKAIATLACAAALTACGGGSNNDATATPLPPQPTFAMVDVTKPDDNAPKVASGDVVTFNYTGWLYDDANKVDHKGAQFESTTKDNGSQPIAMTVGVGARIAGWDQGLIGMNAGGTRLITLPASMAFGPAGLTDSSGKVLVPANTAVIYELKVISFATVSPIGRTDTVVGTGTTAASKNLVTINYTGYLRDDSKPGKKGAQFEASAPGSPFSFLLNVGSRIEGWDQGILGMKVGGKRTLVIPSSMAWGANGRTDSAGNVIVPPNTDVVYDIELTAVNTTPPESTVQPQFKITDELVGTGAVTAAKGSTLTVYYSGYLYNDSVTDKKGVRFDSLRTGSAFSVKLGDNKVIAGWEQGLLGVKEKGKRTLVIPASLAYGSNAQPNIPANSALIFDIEVKSVQ